MREEEFRQYLRYTVGYDEGTCRSRVSNCLRIESFEGSLDEAFERDGMRTLLERLRYSTADARAGAPARHRIPIDGDVRNGTATLRNAANLYLDFRNGVKKECRNALADAPEHQPHCWLEAESCQRRFRGPTGLSLIWMTVCVWLRCSCAMSVFCLLRLWRRSPRITRGIDSSGVGH